ncbi:hypothetical protein RBB50_009960 [Rhinocladiella similis]
MPADQSALESPPQRPSGHVDAIGGLNIVIIGAGIAGLTLALSLHGNGHAITVYESSKFSTEVGAAIHIAPNANGVLKRLGISSRALGANECLSLKNYSCEGRLLASIPVGKTNHLWQHKWRLVHRIRLHDALKKAVLGKGIDLKLGYAVSRVDPETGLVYFKDESMGAVRADVVLGADGVHATTRSCLPLTKDIKPFDSGKSAFRFLVSKDALFDDERTRQFVDTPGQLVMAYGPDRRVVMYPTSDNTVINFVCIHPSAETVHVATGDWNNFGNLEMVLKVYEHWGDNFKAALSKADPQSIRVWNLLDMDVLDTWVCGKLALLGDAAHPFLPHQGQGGAQAIEDAITLGVVLEKGLKPSAVPERLKLYQRIRKERADKIQQYTRLAGRDLAPGEKEALNMMAFVQYNFGHDEYDFSRQKLREWKWAQNPEASWRMPVAFGPMPGPRQDSQGFPRDGNEDGTATVVSVEFKTSATLLQGLFPPANITAAGEAWTFSSSGTVASCTLALTVFENLPWLGGRGYMTLGLYVDGVRHSTFPTGSEPRVKNGKYLPVLFESLPDPILSGRDELGMAKLFSTIDVELDQGSCQARASWEGSTWMRLELEEFTDARPLDVANEAAGVRNRNPGAFANAVVQEALTSTVLDMPLLTQSIDPPFCRATKGTQQGLAHAVVDREPCAFSSSSLQPQPKGTRRARTASRAEFRFYPRNEKSLPTLHHIVDRLAELPVYEIVLAKVVENVQPTPKALRLD